MSDPRVVMMERCRNANAAGIHHLLESRPVEAVEAFKVALRVVKGVVTCYDEDHNRFHEREMEQSAVQVESTRRICFPVRQRPPAPPNHASTMIGVESSKEDIADGAADKSRVGTVGDNGEYTQASLENTSNTNLPTRTPMVLDTSDSSQRNKNHFTSGPGGGDFKSGKEQHGCSIQCLYRAPLEIAEFAAFTSRGVALQLSVTAIFNMALSRHLHGLDAKLCSIKQRRGALLRQALSLYELAYTIATQENIDDQVLRMEMAMAITNNMGHIYTLLGNLEDASRCFQQLLTTIILVQQRMPLGSTSSSENDCQQVEVEDMQIFVRSVEHLILTNGLVAPAA